MAWLFDFTDNVQFNPDTMKLKASKDGGAGHIHHLELFQIYGIQWGYKLVV